MIANMMTIPDMSKALRGMVSYAHDPALHHCEAAKIISYLKRTREPEMTCSKNTPDKRQAFEVCF